MPIASMCRAAIVAAMAAACFWSMAPAAQAQKAGGTLVIVTTPEPTTLTNAFNSATTVGELGTKVYDGLLEYDGDLNPKPSLATEWSISADGKDVTFKLRHDVKWHDGKPFTSADVQFSIFDVLKTNHPRGPGNFGSVQSIDTPDDYTVVLHLAQPYPPMMKAFSSLDAPILPKHLYAGTDLRNNPYNNKPIGTGPFMFKDWQRGDTITLERNPNYWRPNRPYLDRIIYRFINDPATRAAALESGEVQVASFGAIAATEMRRLEKAGIVSIPLGGYQALAPVAMLTFNTVDPPFNDKRVRQAVAYAIDRKFIIEKIFFGFGVPAVGPISSVFKGQGLFTDDVIHFDVPDRIKRATALLDEAGFKPKADGTRLDATLDIGPIGDEYRRMGEYIKQALKQIGINLTLRTEDMAGFTRRTSTTYDFQMASAAWVGMGDPTLGVQRQYVTSNIKKGVPFTNLGRYSNPEIDALWAKFATEIDPKLRADDAHQLQKKLVDDSPMVATARKEVKNLINGAFSVQGGMYETWIDR